MVKHWQVYLRIPILMILTVENAADCCAFLLVPLPRAAIFRLFGSQVISQKTSNLGVFDKIKSVEINSHRKLAVILLECPDQWDFTAFHGVAILPVLQAVVEAPKFTRPQHLTTQHASTSYISSGSSRFGWSQITEGHEWFHIHQGAQGSSWRPCYLWIRWATPRTLPRPQSSPWAAYTMDKPAIIQNNCAFGITALTWTAYILHPSEKQQRIVSGSIRVQTMLMLCSALLCPMLKKVFGELDCKSTEVILSPLFCCKN